MRRLVISLLTIVSLCFSASEFLDTSATGYESSDYITSLFPNGHDADAQFIYAFASNNLVRVDHSTGDVETLGTPEGYYGAGIFNSFVKNMDGDNLLVGFTKTGNVDDRIFKYTISSNSWEEITTFMGNFDCEIFGDEIIISGVNNGSDNGIWLLDTDGNHDLLVQLDGFSTGIAIDSDGNIYNAGESKLYKFDREDIITAIGETHLEVDNGTILSDLEGGAYDTDMDEAGNLFINGNGSYSYLAKWNGTTSDDINYDYLAIGGGSMGGNWFGTISSFGDLNNGGKVFQSDAYNFGLGAVYLPEQLPTTTVPQAPALKVVHQGVELNFTNGREEILVGSNSDLEAEEPTEWISSSSILLNDHGTIKVFAKYDGDDQYFTNIYNVEESYPGPAGDPSTTAIHKDDSVIKSWASSVESITYGEDVDEEWQIPNNALGQAEGTSFDIVCIGRGGEIVLKFDTLIINGPSYDFCVFENGFAANYLEFARVAVSSDGENFAEFDCIYNSETKIETKNIGQMAGKYEQGYGNPFDLEMLKNKDVVLDGLVDLNSISYVKLIDIVGDGDDLDSFGNPILDPYPTSGAAGFDLDAIGVMNDGVVSIGENLVADDDIISNYPNPFNPTTTISFNSINNNNSAKLSIFNSNGELIMENNLSNLTKGINNHTIDMTQFNSGVYFYSVAIDGKSLTSRMLLIK